MKLIELPSNDLREAAFYPTLDEALLNAGANNLDGDDEIGVLVAHDVKSGECMYAVELEYGFNRSDEYKYVLKSDLDCCEELFNLYKGFVITVDDTLKYEPLW